MRSRVGGPSLSPADATTYKNQRRRSGSEKNQRGVESVRLLHPAPSTALLTKISVDLQTFGDPTDCPLRSRASSSVYHADFCHRVAVRR